MIALAGRSAEPTQFVRALRTLDVESIHSGSPQAKGRVERANVTLQDRLVKEMRLRGICAMDAGNAYLPTFMADHNRRFAVMPRNPSDAHRAVLHDEGEAPLPVEDEKSVRLRVDRAKAEQQSRPAWKPAWRVNQDETRSHLDRRGRPPASSA